MGVLPCGEALPSWGIAVSSASGLIAKLGSFGWFLALFFGFCIMFSTALSNVDLVVRQGTDMLWFASDRMRKWSREDIRRVYYALLVVFVIWGSIYVNILVPLIILAIKDKKGCPSIRYRPPLSASAGGCAIYGLHSHVQNFQNK